MSNRSGILNSDGSGSYPLFQLFGIQVSVHWTWILVAFYQIQAHKDEYSSILWNIAEYLSLFGIVLMHEFGHSLACRSVGGRSDRILLWPLGGAAFVSPPPRPGAWLWSIAAGPLVNVVLVPVTMALHFYVGPRVSDDVADYLYMLMLINGVLLVFNLLPIYPLDGGQILRSLLWFFLGRGRSLTVAAVIGVIGAAGLAFWALSIRSTWMAIMAAFALWTAWRGVQQGRAMHQLDALPRHAHARCPSCSQPPPVGMNWICECGQPFDTFVTGGGCPRCGKVYHEAGCPFCSTLSPRQAWHPPGFPVVPLATPPASDERAPYSV